MNAPVSVHGSLIAYQGMGILIVGPSGSFKTRLCVEAMMYGAKFIADDQVVLSLNMGMLMGGPRPGFQGVLELRGVGLIKLPDAATQQVVSAVVELTPLEQIERLPVAKEMRDFLGVTVPVIRMASPPHSSGGVLLSAVKWVQEGRLLPSDWRPGA